MCKKSLLHKHLTCYVDRLTNQPQKNLPKYSYYFFIQYCKESLLSSTQSLVNLFNMKAKAIHCTVKGLNTYCKTICSSYFMSKMNKHLTKQFKLRPQQA